MTPEDADIASQLDERKPRRHSGGATIVEDGRVTSFIQWIWTGLGGCVIGSVVYVGSQLSGLKDAVAETNLQVALARQQNSAIVEQLKDHEARLRENEGDIRVIEGRNLRGGPGAAGGH